MSRIFKWLTEVLENVTKANLESYLSLETVDPHERLFVGRDGSLASIIRVDGMRKMMGQEEMEAITRASTDALHPFMIGPGHAVQVWFMRDPDLSGVMLKNMVRPARDTAKALGLQLDDLFEEREKVLPKFLVHEAFYIVLWTRPSIFSKQELERLKLDMKAPKIWPRTVDTGDVFRAVTQIRVKHSSFISSFMGEMAGAGLRMEVLGGQEAMAAMRASLYPELTLCDWKPWIAGQDAALDSGDKTARMPPARVLSTAFKKGDVSHLLWPRLRDHMFPLGAEVVNSSIAKVGSRLMGGVDVVIGPQTIQPFQKLLDSIIGSSMFGGSEFPWRVSFLIEADGVGRMQFKSILAAMASLTGGSNPLIRDSIRALQARKIEGEAIVKLRTSFATWASLGEQRVVEERVGRLLKLVETWGLQTASQSMGDPLDGVMSSALALSTSSTAPVGAEPLRDVTARLPWMRDASPFSEGSVLFRTFDGRAWPFQPGSTEHQDTSVDFVYAPPGKGKSVWLNTTNLAFCLNSKSTQGTGGSMLPRVAIIDIGLSSSGLISLLQEALPPGQQSQALYKRLRMDKEDSINPFDTQLGYRKPLPLERSFLVNFLSLLGTEPGRTSPPDGLIGLCSMVVDEIYELLSDQSRTGKPKPYVPQQDDEVDEALENAGITPPEDSTWWWVTDALFRGVKGEEGVRLASLAQRYAVPLLEDLPAIAGSSRVYDIFGETTVQGSNEGIIKMFERSVSTALRAYPILVEPTRLDLGNARVVSLDLNDAAPGKGSPGDNKQTAIVYMLARFILARDFYLYPDDVRGASELYQDYQSRRIQRIRETPKRLVFDEFHRTKAVDSIRQQVTVDMREGRKHGVQIALASQMLDDFDKDMLGLGSGFWIMGCSNEQDKEATREKFGLGATARASLDQLNGPRPNGQGAPFLVILNMRDGTHEHLLLNTLGPVEMWAFSTTPEDVELRRQLYTLVGPQEGRRRLAARFPTGKAGAEIDRRKKVMNSQGRLDMNAQKGIITALAEEIASSKM